MRCTVTHPLDEDPNFCPPTATEHLEQEIRDLEAQARRDAETIERLQELLDQRQTMDFKKAEQILIERHRDACAKLHKLVCEDRDRNEPIPFHIYSTRDEEMAAHAELIRLRHVVANLEGAGHET